MLPIRDFLTLTIAVLAGLFIMNPGNFNVAVRKALAQILREVVRTDNWGNPSIYQYSQKGVVKKHK